MEQWPPLFLCYINQKCSGHIQYHTHAAVCFCFPHLTIAFMKMTSPLPTAATTFSQSKQGCKTRRQSVTASR